MAISGVAQVPQSFGDGHHRAGTAGFTEPGGAGFLLCHGHGHSAGLFHCRSQGDWGDYCGSFIALFVICIPALVIGPVLMMLFAIHWRWFPVALWGSPARHFADAHARPLFHRARGRLMHEGMLGTLHAEFITTARSKGLGEMAVLLKHAFRIGILPVVSYSGPMLADLLTARSSSRTFPNSSIGVFMVDSSLNRDYTMVVGLSCSTRFCCWPLIWRLISFSLCWTRGCIMSRLEHLSPNQRRGVAFAATGPLRRLPFFWRCWFWPFYFGRSSAACHCATPARGPTHLPDAISDAQFEPPGIEHWFGTDVHGRDQLSRVWYGARISLLVVWSARRQPGHWRVVGRVAGYCGGRWTV